MFGMKRRDSERKIEADKRWEERNGPLPLFPHYVGTDCYMAAGYDLEKGDLTLWTGKRYWYPGPYGPAGIHKYPFKVFAVGTWDTLSIGEEEPSPSTPDP